MKLSKQQKNTGAITAGLVLVFGLFAWWVISAPSTGETVWDEFEKRYPELLTPPPTVTQPPVTLPPVTVTPKPEIIYRTIAPTRASRSEYRADNTGRPTGLWLELAKCESGADLRKNTGNGFLGAYQFLPSTWTGFTHGRFGPVLEANWPTQTYVAYRVWLKQGWTSGFPGCGKKMGYPKMPAVPAP